MRLNRPAAALRKAPSRRRQVRRAAFEEAIAGAGRMLLRKDNFAPSPPDFSPTAARPVCALTAADGKDMRIAVLLERTQEGVTLLAATPPRPVAMIKLGKMWAAPSGEGWLLLDRLAPSWTSA